jgi:hypothetical protein
MATIRQELYFTVSHKTVATRFRTIRKIIDQYRRGKGWFFIISVKCPSAIFHPMAALTTGTKENVFAIRKIMYFGQYHHHLSTVQKPKKGGIQRKTGY